MAYQKQNWENFPSTGTPISADRLSHLETQYDESVSYTDSALSDKATLDQTGKVQISQLPVSDQPQPNTIPVRGAGGVVSGVGFPLQNDDAATKVYVDQQVASGGGVAGGSVRPRAVGVLTYGRTSGGINFKKIRVPGGPTPGLMTNHYAGPVEIGPTPVAQPLDYYYNRFGGTVLFNSTGFGGQRMWGPVIKDGVILQEIQTGSRGSEVLGFRADGTAGRYYGARGDTAASMVADGVTEAFSFGCFLVEDGVPRDVDNDPVFNAFAPLSARQILGIEADGSVVLITTEGKSGSYGLTGTQTSQFALDQGLVNAVMLDGGGSAQTTVNGRQIHPSTDTGGTRDVPGVGEMRAVIPRVYSGWWDVPYASGVTFTQSNRSLQVCKENGQVRLRGTAQTTFVAGQFKLVATLPEEYRPDAPSFIWDACVGPLGESGTASISALTGEIQVRFGSTPPSYVDFGTVDYSAKW